MTRTAWLAGSLAVVLVAAATGGWGLGAWAQRGVDRAAGADADHAQRGGTAPSGQRSNSQAQRQQQRADFLPPAGRWRWWRDEEVQRDAGLSAAQVQRLEAMVKERETELAPFIREWARQGQLLNQMARDRRVSIDEFAVQASRVQSLYAKLSESRNIMLYRMSRDLTDEQFTRIKELQEARDRRLRGGGRSSSPNR
ncbi:MAG TPA: hypothetical protein VMM93_11275 [Vicinamibacterales bacterium]|nr:hypothetical protein [Vicinamibacterales bacterium]